MHSFVDIEVWPLIKGQGKQIISYSNSLKVIENDEKAKKASYWKKYFFYLKMEKGFSKRYEENFVYVHAKEKISKFGLLQNNC